MDPNVIVAVCFLAHGGITQPLVWERYRELSGGFLGFSVHTNRERIEKLPASFQSGAVEDPIETEWFGMSLVQASFLAFKKAYSIFPNAQLFVLLPGNSIPCCSPPTLLDLVDSDRFYLSTTSNGGNDKEPGIRPVNGGPPKTFFAPRLDICEHSQFLAIRRKDVVCLERALEDLKPWEDLLETSRVANCCLSTPPDEFVIGTALCSEFGREEGDFERFEEFCYCAMREVATCLKEECQTVFFRAVELQEFLMPAISYCFLYRASIAIRKVPEDHDWVEIWEALENSIKEEERLQHNH